MTELLDYARFYDISEWLALVLLIGGLLFLNRCFGLRYFNALLLSQIILIFNAIPIIAGYASGYLPAERVIHFASTEAVLMITMCAVYAFIVKQALANPELTGKFFTGTVLYILILSGLALAIFSYAITPQDGTSRILYQTNYWYSVIKPFSALIIPLSYFAAFVVLMVHRRRVPAYSLLIISVLGSIAAGSKGAFVTQALVAFLMVRDFGMTTRYRVGRADVALGVAGLAAGVALSLQRLRLNVADLWDRVMLYGEPTLLTYFAPDPTAACNSLSLFAKMHRGWARAFGDPGALNIDTLFGYAWTIQYVGVNTFTGPNARYSAYMACNFPDELTPFGLAMTGLYFLLLTTAIRWSTRKELFFPVILSFSVFSLSTIGQDFNVLMQDINYLIAFLVLMLVLPGRSEKHPSFPSLEVRRS